MSSADETSQNSLATFKNTIFINLGVCLVLWVAFEANRNFKLIYFNRVKDKLVKEHRVPPVPSRRPLAWLTEISKVTEEECLRMLGLDAYIFLRFIKICMRISAVGSFMALVILVPIYSTSGGGMSDWNRYTIANIPNHGQMLWIPVCFAYLFATYFMYLMHMEYKSFVEKRQDFLLKGDVTTHPQTYYTCMIERIPSEIRTVNKLREYFESFFPHQVHSVEIALELHELEALAEARHQVRNNLEKAVAIWKATDNRKSVWVKMDCYDGYEDPPKPYEFSNALRYFGCSSLFGYVIYDAIEHWTKQLIIMNNRVKELQGANLNFTNHVSSKNLDTSRLSFFTSKVGEVVHQTAANVISLTYSHSGDKLKDPLIENETLKDSNMEANEEDSLKEPDTKASSPSNVFKNFNLEKHGSGISEEDLEKPNEDAKQSDSNGVVDAIVEVPKQIVSAGVNVLTSFGSEGLKTMRLATSGAVKGLHKITRTLELLTIGADFKVSNTAFVTFTNRQAQASTHQCLLSHKFEYYKMGITNAPSPSDIIWENVAIPVEQINVRTAVVDVGLNLGLIFWGTVVGFISAIGNLDSLSKTAGFHFLAKYTDTPFFIKINSYLAAGILLIFLNYLPVIFELLAWSYEGLKLRSAIQEVTFIRYFKYQFLQIFLGVAFTSLLVLIDQFSSTDFKGIVNTLGDSVPNAASYFTILVITKTFTALPFEMLRIGPLLYILSVKMFIDKKKCTRRELRTGIFENYEMDYACYYPNIMMVLMLMSIYFVISPIIIPFCFCFFGVAYVVYKYQLLYVYVNPFQSGGFLWYSVFPRAMVSLMGGVFVLLAYLAIQSTYDTGPFWGLLPLIPIIWVFWQHTEDRFKAPSLTVSLETAIYIDRSMSKSSDKQTDINKSFSEVRYRQPSLNEGEIKPEAYRRSKKDTHSRAPSGSGQTNSPLFKSNLLDLKDEGQQRKMSMASEAGDNEDDGYSNNSNIFKSSSYDTNISNPDIEVVEAEVDGILDNPDDTNDEIGRDLERASNYSRGS